VAQSTAKLRGKRVSPLGSIDSSSDPLDIMDHVFKGRRTQGEDIRRKWKRLDGTCELVWRHGADMTQVLCQNDIKLGQMKGSLVELIQRTSRRDQFFDSLIDI
jgi:hypothetical protein